MLKKNCKKKIIFLAHGLPLLANRWIIIERGSSPQLTIGKIKSLKIQGFLVSPLRKSVRKVLVRRRLGRDCAAEKLPRRPHKPIQASASASLPNVQNLKSKFERKLRWPHKPNQTFSTRSVHSKSPHIQKAWGPHKTALHT